MYSDRSAAKVLEGWARNEIGKAGKRSRNETGAGDEARGRTTTSGTLVREIVRVRKRKRDD